MRRTALVILFVVGSGVCAALHAADPGPTIRRAPRAAPWALAATPDGRSLFAACGPTGSVVRIDVEARGVVDRLEMGGTPRGLAVSRDGGRLAVSLGPEDEVVLVDTGTGRQLRRIEVGLGPEGVAFAADGQSLFVALRLSEEIATLDLESFQVVRRVRAGREPFALALSPDGRVLAAVSRRATLADPALCPSAEVTLLAAESGAVLHRVPLDSCHLSEACAFTPDGSRLLVPALRVRNLLPVLQVARGWVVSGVLALVDPRSGTARVLPLNEPQAGFADPTGVTFLPGTGRAYVVSSGGNSVGVIDVGALRAQEHEGGPDQPERLSLTHTYVLDRVEVGAHPCGMTVVQDGARSLVAVSERLQDRVTLLDENGLVVAAIDIGDRRDPDALLRGERAFHDASYCFQDAFTCRSCHPEAHTDGLTYDFEIDGVGEHVVLNRSLLGLAGTRPFKWTGINPSLQRQCGARFAMVLTRAEVFPPDLLDDMAAWLLTLPPPRPVLDASFASDVGRASIERGRRIFERSRARDGRRLRPSERCITCHPPPHYTNRQVVDVGTRASRDPMGAFDVPHLIGGGQKAPYLHDGRAMTLESIWTAEGVGDRHGFVSDLSAADLADLVLFLLTL